MKVLDELDRFKPHNDELRRNSRLTIRTIDSLRDGGGFPPFR